MLGVSAGTTLAIALAVVVGVIPPQGHDTGLSSAAAAELHDPAPVTPGEEKEVVPETVPAAGAEPAPADEAPAAASPDSEPVPATAPPPAAEEPPPPPPAPPVNIAPAAAPAPPPAPTANPVVPRRQPSPAEVQQALDGLEPYVDSVFSPSAAQVAEAGAKVCTAFDEGQTFAQVKATAQELVSRVPLTTVRPGADDYVVRTVVRLYCPGHQAKLV